MSSRRTPYRSAITDSDSPRWTMCTNGVGATVTTGDGVGVRRGGSVGTVVGPALDDGAAVNTGVGRGVGVPRSAPDPGTARRVASIQAAITPANTAMTSTITVPVTQRASPFPALPRARRSGSSWPGPGGELKSVGTRAG